MGEIIDASKFLVVDKASGVICRECDLPMQFEQESPEEYFLYKCQVHPQNRVGLLVKGLNKVLDSLIED